MLIGDVGAEGMRERVEARLGRHVDDFTLPVAPAPRNHLGVHGQNDGLFAVGEAACVSVHGANRLGSNSLIDLVVFGRAAGLRLAEVVKAGAIQDELPTDAAEIALSRLDTCRHAEGGSATVAVPPFTGVLPDVLPGALPDDEQAAAVRATAAVTATAASRTG